MNNRQKEILQSQLNSEKRTIEELKRVYAQASRDCEAKIRELSARTDMENLQSIIYQKQYQEVLKKQLDNVLEQLHANEFASIQDYLVNCYTDGFVGCMYDIAGQGIPMIVPINQEQIVKALQIDSKISTGLYTRLGEDVKQLKTNIRAQLSRGIANGSTWNQIATSIAKDMKSDYNKAYNSAIRITRTEGHRVQCQSAYDAQVKAKSKGADVLRQWDSTLDGKTRDNHRLLDGQIREMEEPFEVNGKEAMYPGGFGDPSEDCNCRCALLQRARWALDEDELKTLQDRAEYYELDKSEDFDDYKSKYLNAAQQEADDAQKNTESTGQEKALTDEELSKKIGANVDLSKMDERLAAEYRAAIADFYDQYPELKGFVDDIDTKVTTFGATGQADIAWEYKGVNANISTSVSFSARSDYEQYMKDVVANFENGSKFENDGAEANAYHELSHQLQRMVYYSEKGLYKDGEFVPQSIMTDLKKTYDVSSDSTKIVRSALKTVGGKDYNYHDLTDYLGTYAQSNNTEMVAQAMAYEMSGKTNPFSAEIKRQMDARYQNVVAKNGKSSTIESIHIGERKSERNIANEQITDAIKNPLHKSDVTYDDLGRPSVKYIGKDVTVCINPDTNVEITTWKTSSRIRRKYENEGD